jgi:hypothetical protein
MAHSPFCRCGGGHCKHHAAGELCPNKPVPPISFVTDMQTGTPIASSACGLCEECLEHEQLEDSETE